MEKTKAQKAFDLAFKYEKELHGCGQSTIKALLDTYNINNDELYKSLSGFAAGGGMEGDGTCGAYLAGVFFLGLKFGRSSHDIGKYPDDPRGSKKNRKLNELIKKLHEKFINEYGNIICENIHRKIYGRPFYIVDDDELKKFENSGAHDRGCTSVCGNAAKWTAEILEEAKRSRR
jgi:C_GCAxxG_C_C family probable redox protein